MVLRPFSTSGRLTSKRLPVSAIGGRRKPETIKGHYLRLCERMHLSIDQKESESGLKMGSCTRCGLDPAPFAASHPYLTFIAKTPVTLSHFRGPP